MSKILVAIPHTGNIRTGLMEWWISFDRMGHDVELFMSYDRPIPSNRNRIVKAFLGGDWDWLMMIDSDVIPQVNIMSIINSGKDIISPLCLINKNGNLSSNAVMNVKDGWKTLIEFEKGLNEVDAVGTGCIFIRRDVIEKIKKPLFEYEYDNDGILSNGEDFNFCDKAREAGYKIYYDTRYKTKHSTTMEL